MFPLLLVVVLITHPFLVWADCPLVPHPLNPWIYFDLNPLMNNEADYSSPNTRYPTNYFLLNVCRPIISTNSSCDSTTGICERSIYTHEPPRKVGSQLDKIRVNLDGTLTGVYPGDSTCYSGEITFICKPGSGVGAPVFVSENCVYKFNWETEFACPLTGALPSPPEIFEVFEDILEHLATGGALRIVYFHDRCSDGNHTLDGNTIENFFFQIEKEMISSTQSVVTVYGETPAHKIVRTEINCCNVVTVTSFVDLVTGRLLERQEIFCKYYENAVEKGAFIYPI